MTTEAQLLAAHRKRLDEAFKERYPEGQFVVQRWHYMALHWNPKRRTSWESFRGISTRQVPGSEFIEQDEYQSSSFGKCTYYKTVSKALAAANRFGFPPELVQAFYERYMARHTEGFER